MPRLSSDALMLAGGVVQADASLAGRRLHDDEVAAGIVVVEQRLASSRFFFETVPL
jgi:hypothetical protein